MLVYLSIAVTFKYPSPAVASLHHCTNRGGSYKGTAQIPIEGGKNCIIIYLKKSFQLKKLRDLWRDLWIYCKDLTAWVRNP
jgi:hypothetical protein